MSPQPNPNINESLLTFPSPMICSKTTMIMISLGQMKQSNCRSSCPEVFCKKCVFRNFEKFTGKHLYQRLFFNKVAGLACNFMKKESLAQVAASIIDVEVSGMTKYSTYTWHLIQALESASPASCKTPATSIDFVHLNNQPR